jgi:hypothetical protein
MLAAGWLDNYQVNNQCIKVLSALRGVPSTLVQPVGVSGGMNYKSSSKASTRAALRHLTGIYFRHGSVSKLVYRSFGFSAVPIGHRMSWARFDFPQILSLSRLLGCFPPLLSGLLLLWVRRFVAGSLRIGPRTMARPTNVAKRWLGATLVSPW